MTHPHDPPYAFPYTSWLLLVFYLAVIMLCVVFTLQAVGALS